MDRPAGGIELADIAEHSDHGIGRLSRQLLRQNLSRHPDRLRIDSLMQLLVDRIVLTYASRPIAPRWREGLSPHSLRRVMELLRHEFMHEITLDALAAAAGLSRAHFLRGFRREVGMPPHAFLTMLRLHEAGTLIRNTQRGFADIAVATGFASHAHMSAVFRQTLALSPSELREPARFGLDDNIALTLP
jgi:AraC family transcriptional regulator